MQGLNDLSLACLCSALSLSFWVCPDSTLPVWGERWSIYQPLPHLSEKAMAPHSSTPAWKIPWMEEPGRLQSMGSLRVRQDSATSLSLFTFTHWRREMATHSTVLAWRISGTGEPDGLPSMGSHRVGHDWSDLAAAAAASSLKVSSFLNHLFMLSGTQDESGQILWSRFSNRHLWMKSSSGRKQKSSRIF